MTDPMFVQVACDAAKQALDELECRHDDAAVVHDGIVTAIGERVGTYAARYVTGWEALKGRNADGSPGYRECLHCADRAARAALEAAGYPVGTYPLGRPTANRRTA